MRFLVLSDLHGNATALDAVVAASAGRWERAVCLGDLVGYGPDPNEVIDRTRELATTVIRGNHDKAASGITDLDDFNPVAAAALNWTRSQLNSKNLDYLRGLPGGPAEADGLVLVHGSLRDEDEYVFSAEQAYDNLVAATAPLTLFGHTHHQGGFSLRDDYIQMVNLREAGGGLFALRMESGTRYLINPGSVGQPRDGDPRAAFAIVDTASNVVEFWRVPYDIEAVQERMTHVAAPEALVARLAWGR